MENKYENIFKKVGKNLDSLINKAPGVIDKIEEKAMKIVDDINENIGSKEETFQNISEIIDEIIDNVNENLKKNPNLKLYIDLKKDFATAALLEVKLKKIKKESLLKITILAKDTGEVKYYTIKIDQSKYTMKNIKLEQTKDFIEITIKRRKRKNR